MAADVELFSLLFDRVLDLTRHGAIRWRSENDPDTYFSADFARSSLILKIDYDPQPPVHVLELYNSDGTVVAYFSPNEDPDDYSEHVTHIQQDVRPLYDLVVERVYRPVETVNDLLGELEKLEQKHAVNP